MITIINLLIDWFCEKRIMFLYNYRMHSLCIDENTYMMLKIKESLYYTYKKIMNWLLILLFLKHFDKFGRGLKIFSVRHFKYGLLLAKTHGSESFLTIFWPAIHWNHYLTKSILDFCLDMLYLSRVSQCQICGSIYTSLTNEAIPSNVLFLNFI